MLFAPNQVACDLYVNVNGGFEIASLNEVAAKYDCLLTQRLALKMCSSKALADESIREMLKAKFATLERECFGLVMLTADLRMTEIVVMHVGSVVGVEVSDRECVKAVLKANAVNVIAFHNHPSGNPEPSRGDIYATGNLKKALLLVDVKVLDHIIIAGPKTVSMEELGLL